ncbi:MAG: DUF1844 domain-containing protein [Desulfarculales bacterium]|jgi:hypothetical protein|nr:DUF1844 domain-containing protein [Desulfarculales bacterium]
MSDMAQGFTVKDKRFFNQNGSERESEAADPARPDPDSHPQESENREETVKKEAGGEEQRNLPPADFGSFIISLAHAAMLHMGQISNPDGSRTEKNMPLARHTIDTIAMLQKKTKGNLAQDEQALMDGILTELRMQYVQTCKKQ